MVDRPDQPPLDFTSAWEDVRELNALCFALRAGFRRLHPEAPEAPEAPFEREYREAVDGVLARHGVDLRHLLAD